MYTTLNEIRAHSPCGPGWEMLLRGLGKAKADDEPLGIATILDINDLDDALWCLRAVEGHDKEIRLLAVAYARDVQHLMTDPRSIAALDVAERFAKGEATAEELAAARAAAWDAALAAGDAWAAGAAARASALAAAGAAGDAAGDAAWAAWAARAARASARAADAAAAAWAAAGAAARGKQEQMLRDACK